MTLKNKFKKQLDTATPKLNRPHFQAQQCETIADDFAIEFASWIRWNVIEVSRGWQFDGKFYNDEQLLKIFKKEKGL
jgi:hypothetical protein